MSIEEEIKIFSIEIENDYEIEINENNIYEKDEELNEFLDIKYDIENIYNYIKNISKNTIFPLFDKLNYYSLFNFLYEDKEFNSEYLF
jgi:hypothetical protein